jgi:hypothetical protein
MDIEGAEYEVFSVVQESSLNKIHRIVGELHVGNIEQERGARSLTKILSDGGFEVRVLATPLQDNLRGILKPWNCSLRRLNGKNPLAYRLFLSCMYGGGLATRGLKKHADIGSTYIFFAHRSFVPRT